MYYLKVFPFYSILITIQSWVVIFFFGYGTFTETAVKAKMIPLTCTWQGFLFFFRDCSLGYVSYCSFFLLEIALFWKSLPFIKNTLGKLNSPKHIPREPPLQVSGADGEVSAKGFVFLMFFPVATAHAFACSWEQLHGARVFIKQVHSRFDRKIRIDSTVENTMCNLKYSTTVSQLFANGERSVFC